MCSLVLTSQQPSSWTPDPGSQAPFCFRFYDPPGKLTNADRQVLLHKHGTSTAAQNPQFRRGWEFMFCGHHLQVLNNSIFEYKFSKWSSMGQRTTRQDCPTQLPLLPPSPGWVLSSVFPSPFEQGQLPPCFSIRVLHTDTGRVGFRYVGSGCFQWGMVKPPHHPQQAACRHSPQWSRDSVGRVQSPGLPISCGLGQRAQGKGRQLAQLPCPTRSQHLSQGTWEPCSQWARFMCQVCVYGVGLKCLSRSALTLGVSPWPKEWH